MAEKDYLVMSTDIKIYKILLETKNLCQKEIAKKMNTSETSISRRLQKIGEFNFIQKEKIKGQNKNTYSIKKEFILKIKNLIALFD